MTREEEIRQAQVAIYGTEHCRAAEHFEQGAQWADKTMLEKVSKWIDDNLERYILEGRDGKPYISVALTDDLRRAMEGV